MIPIPNASAANANQLKLGAGEHVVYLNSIKYNQKAKKVVVEYLTFDAIRVPGGKELTGFYEEWLGSGTEGQAKRTFAYLCRLHELAGLPVPPGSEFDEEALVDAHKVKGVRIALALKEDIYNGQTYVKSAEFPMLASDPGLDF